jgi:hypothetical protein
MKKIGLLVAFLGLVSGAMYATGYNFSTLKNKFITPVKSPATKSKLGSVDNAGSTTGVGHNVSSISKSYTNATTEREW